MKKLLLVVVSVLAVYANAAREIVMQVPKLVDGCYLISNAAELYKVAFSFMDPKTDCVKLTADIVVNENVIKDGTLNVADTANFAVWQRYAFFDFEGVFDGQGHTISGLYFNDSTVDLVGLFGRVGNSWTGGIIENIVIKDVHLVDTYFKAGSNVGGLVGEAEDGINLVIERSSVDGIIEGDDHAGGLIGYLDDSRFVSIYDSYNAASVTATYYAGGIAGCMLWGAHLRIANAYNVGTVSGQRKIGGIIAYVDEDADGLELINVFNVGQVVASEENSSDINSFGYIDVYSLDSYVLDNVFFLGSNKEGVGTSVTEELFANGTVASIMHGYNYDGVDGSIWGQEVGVDPLPNFSGVVSGAVTLPSITLSLDTGSAELWTMELPIGYRHRIPDVKRENYELFGWYDNAALTGEKVTHVPETQTTDVKFWGHYEPVYKVVLETSGGTVPVDSMGSYIRSVGAKLPNGALREGYVFAGWYTSSDYSGSPVDSIAATDEGDKTFYAKWIEMRAPKKNADGCYAISDAGELYGFAAIVNAEETLGPNKAACAVLTQDIVVNRNVLDSAGNLNEKDALAFVPWNPIDREPLMGRCTRFRACTLWIP